MKTIVSLLGALAVVFFFVPTTHADSVFYLAYGTHLQNINPTGNPLWGATTTAAKAEPAGTTLYMAYCVNIDNGGNGALTSAQVNFGSQTGTFLMAQPQYPFSGVSAQYCSHWQETIVNAVASGQQFFVSWPVNGVWGFQTASLASSTSDFFFVGDDPSTIVFDINSATSSGLYAAGLGGMNFASSSIQCSTGNLFSDGFCTAIAYLFVPDPNILQKYATLFATSSTDGFFSRFPASYAVGISGAFAGLNASSSQNLALVILPLSQGDTASSTAFGRILPDFTVLSTTTISKYYPDGIRNTMNGLVAFGLWLGLGTDIFFYVRNKMHRV